MALTGKFQRLKAKLAGGGVEVHQVLVAGAGANTNIAITGIKANAEVLAIIDVTTPADMTSHWSKVTAGNIQLDTTTSAKNLLVLYAQPA